MIKIIKKMLGQRPDVFSSKVMSYYNGLNQAKWMDRSFEKFSDEAYIKNVIAHRSISLISQAAASVNFKLFQKKSRSKIAINDHPILKLISRPNPTQSGREFFESIYSYKLISGNSFVLGLSSNENQLAELYSLRPDKVNVVSGETLIPAAYEYQIGNSITTYPVDQIHGYSDILHLKNFHPLSENLGLSSIEAAAYSIDQHNHAGLWNQSLLQHGARPSGVIVANGEPLSERQVEELKGQIDDLFSGPQNAGRPILMQGGLEWKEMSLSPKDMDFIESKHSSARDIALAFGVPPQLLGIPGDNTYSNLQEARLALWEQTVIPMVENVTLSLSNWLKQYFPQDLELMIDLDSIHALSPRREQHWNKINKCEFMTINEKRQALGLPPLSNGDFINSKTE